MGEVVGDEGFDELAGSVVFDDVGQAAGVADYHRAAAGVGFDASCGQVVLSRGITMASEAL